MNYIGLDNHVHELIYTGQWANNDLTDLAQPPKSKKMPNADPIKGLAGYQTSNGYEHVNYMSADFHVYELIYTGKWALNDLTQLAGVPALAETSLTGD